MSRGLDRPRAISFRAVVGVAVFVLGACALRAGSLTMLVWTLIAGATLGLDALFTDPASETPDD